MLVRGLHANCGFGRGRQGLYLLFTVVLRQLVSIQGIAVVGEATNLAKKQKARLREIATKDISTRGIL